MTSLKRTKLPQLASEHECTACLACENVCVQNAITHSFAPDGHTYVYIDQNKCVGCLKCQNVCSRSRQCFGENNLNASKIYAAWSEDDVKRERATSGGVFAAFAERVLSDGGCVIGAELCGFECKHVVIYDKKDIQRLQGSKYMASSMEDVYKIIKAEIMKRDVLFTGLGCQCAGVIAFFSDFKTDYKLYTVDLVCGGISSKILIDRFREENPDVNGILSFRTKGKYELKVISEDGEKVIPGKSLPLHGFNCGLTNRFKCYDCQFAKAHRKTDITIGDLWDYCVLSEEQKKGVSMLIVHSLNGLSLMESSMIKLQRIEWKGALLHNKRIVCGHQNIYYPRIKLLDYGMKMNQARLKRLYTVSMKVTDLDLFVFRIYRKIREKILSYRNERVILAMLKEDIKK